MTIGTEQHEILDLGIAAFLSAVNNIVESGLTFERNFQTHGEWLARRSAPVGFFFRQIAIGIAALVQAFSGVGARSFGDAFLHGLVVALFFGSEVAISLAFFDQAIGGVAMLRRVCRLEDELFVVVESEPLESFDDGAC